MGKSSEMSVGKPTRRQSWLRVVIGVALIAVACYSVWQSRQQAATPAAGTARPVQDLREQPVEQVQPIEQAQAGNQRRLAIETKSERLPGDATVENATSDKATIIRGQTIRDLDGNVAYEGDIDLTATLDRIRAGERLRFRNDGSTFENRERRLPRKPAGYYQEYVHPTEGLDRPGPQRVVLGQDGEVYYTPDHYRTFQRIKGDE